MQPLLLRSNAKVNIGLHVVGKRADGYHLMETVYYPVPDLYDDIELHPLPGHRCELEMSGLGDEVPLENNLCYKAWQLLEGFVALGKAGMRIVVRKRIPAGAGLGGGSSNAATLMKGLAKFWGLDISDDRLAELGERLGADVPFFIYNKPLYATGIGTVFEPIDLDLAKQGYELRLKTLPVHSSTPLAFQTLDWQTIRQTRPLKDELQLPVHQWRGNVRNDLELSVFPRLPEVAKAKDDLYAEGAVYAAMSGSGSACFGLFRK